MHACIWSHTQQSLSPALHDSVRQGLALSIIRFTCLALRLPYTKEGPLTLAQSIIDESVQRRKRAIDPVETGYSPM